MKRVEVGIEVKKERGMERRGDETRKKTEVRKER